MATPSRVKAIVEAFVGAIQRIDSKRNKEFLTRGPVKAVRGKSAGDIGSAMPAVYVSLSNWRSVPTSAQRHDATATVSCRVFTKNTQDPEGALLELVADIIRQIGKDVTLGALVHYAFPQEFTPAVDVGGSGTATTTLDYEVVFTWDHDAP